MDGVLDGFTDGIMDGVMDGVWSHGWILMKWGCDRAKVWVEVGVLLLHGVADTWNGSAQLDWERTEAREFRG